jgi:REP element-mobilizing transposase RayT
VIFGTYGFWLPNDPRGSWSDFVGAWELFRYGAATTTTERRSVAAASHDIHERLAAKTALTYPPVRFTGQQALAVGQGFATYAQSSGLTIWGCAILPDHVHLVLARFRLNVEPTVVQLKGAATRKLDEANLHPHAVMPRRQGRYPKAFARGEWKVFLDSPADVIRAIRYVEQNPMKEGLPSQRWRFVQPYEPSSPV